MIIRSWLAVLVPVALSAGLVLAEIPAENVLSTASLSLACGAAALSLMSCAALLGARWRWVEAVFGGLDRVYQAHKWMGVWALVLACVHLSFKAGMTGWPAAAILELPSSVTRLVRQLSIVALFVIILLALNRKIPYSTWRWWHKLSGLLFLIVVAHALSIKSPIRLDSPAGIWLSCIVLLGVAGAIYKLLIYRWLSKHAEYRVVAVHQVGSAVRLELLPTAKKLRIRAGQFGFLRMLVDGLREPHPFTIAGNNAVDGRIEFVIRALGDYTQKLVAEVRVGMHAELHAPFGRFERRTSAGREIWIGGGVGISPFLAWLNDPTGARFGLVTLFYFYQPGRDFPAIETLQSLALTRGAEFIAVPDGPTSAVFVERLAEILRQTDRAAVQIDFCGPAGLLDAVRALLTPHALAPTALRHELFEFR